MSNLLTTIQSIAVNAVKSTNPVEFCYGTVTKANPLTVRLNENTLEIYGSSLILTEPVVEKKLTIDKHTHMIGNDVGGHTHKFTYTDQGTPVVSTTNGPNNPMSATTEIVNKVLSGVCNEFGEDLPVESDSEKIVITLNRGLEKGDKVIMLRVYSGQRFIILSRIFTRQDEDDGE